MQLSEIRNIIKPKVLQQGLDQNIVELLVDSRKASYYNKAIFFAIKGDRNDGHDYIHELYKKGVRSFVVSKEINCSGLSESSIYCVNNTTHALQEIAAFHRSQFSLKVVGITGSNGKTIVKEWLKFILSESDLVISSPGSYNSQVGVPLSVWNINSNHNIGIFEAGISQEGEMDKLQKIILPSIGIFTNIGDAHNNGFSNLVSKIREKAKLFKNSKLIFCQSNTPEYTELVKIYGRGRIISWGPNESSDYITKIDGSTLTIKWKGQIEKFNLPFSDEISIENISHCICYSIHESLDLNKVRKKVFELSGVPMRMQIKKGIKNCDIIDDTYNYDLEGLKNALDFMDQNHIKDGKTLILSDFPKQYGLGHEFEIKLSELLKDRDIGQVIAIGNGIKTLENNPNYSNFQSIDNFKSRMSEVFIENQTVLVKGTRDAQLERIVHFLEEQVHGTKLEINLNAIVNNLNVFRSILKPETKVMAMVKAFAYGSGGSEIAQVLEYNKIDYLSVAYVDEGVQLRKDGISVPIMVLNVSESAYDQVTDYNLEPEIYSFNQLNGFVNHLKRKKARSSIHLKFDTGMHRLGFETKDLEKLIVELKRNDAIVLKSVFSHLAISDEQVGDEFTKQQVASFENNCAVLEGAGIIGFDKHILNSNGIIRFPESQFDMVRLGIGLYDKGISNLLSSKLMLVGRLTTTVSQVKNIKKGETIGYGRRGLAEQDLKIATIAIGYADGYSRRLSNGVGEVYINGQLAKVVGTVCMDMTMVDVTGIEVEEGDEVEIFGENIPVRTLAEKCETISYEVLTGISSRVKRIFYSE